MPELNLLKTYKIKPIKDLVAFKWITSSKTESGFFLPENYYDLKSAPGRKDGIRPGHFYLGRVLAVGPKVWNVKVNDLILIHEFGIKNYSGNWKIDEIYFIEEKFIKAKISDFKKKSDSLKLSRLISKQDLEYFDDPEVEYGTQKTSDLDSSAFKNKSFPQPRGLTKGLDKS